MDSGFFSLLRLVWFNTAFFGGLILWTAVSVPASPFICVWKMVYRKLPYEVGLRAFIHSYGIVCCKLLGSLLPLIAVNGARRLPEPCIITPNHQSFFDPYCLGLLKTYNLVFVVRSWPFRIPIYGRLMKRAGYLNTDLLDPDLFFHKSSELLRNGAVMVIFPEGTRSPNGRLGRFRSGAFKLAVDLDVPIVPLCIEGADKVFPKGSRYGRPGPIRVTVLEPVSPSDFQMYGPVAHLRLQRHVKNAMQMVLEPSEKVSHLNMDTIKE